MTTLEKITAWRREAAQPLPLSQLTLAHSVYYAGGWWSVAWITRKTRGVELLLSNGLERCAVEFTTRAAPGLCKHPPPRLRAFIP